MQVRAALGGLTPPQFERVIDGLLSVRGYGPRFGCSEALKAPGDQHDDGGDDFEVAALRDLWKMLEKLWAGYITRVLDDLEGLVAAGAVDFPLDLEKQQDQVVWSALAKRAARMLAAIGVSPLTVDERQASVSRPLDALEICYRLGRLRGALRADTSLDAARGQAAGLRLGADDRRALAHLKASAGAYLRPNVWGVPEDVMRRLLARDREVALRGTLIGVRARVHPNRLAGYMTDLTGVKVERGDGTMVRTGGSWDRDWRRVARTEMARAYNYGHLQAALREHPVNAGAAEGAPLRVPKRLCFKVTQKPRYDDKDRLIAPCKHCYRIWRVDDRTPRLYDLAEVIGNGENATGDDGRPRRADDWRATVGPTHPNDLCGPIQFYNPLALDLYPGFAAQLEAFKGQGYEGVP